MEHQDRQSIANVKRTVGLRLAVDPRGDIAVYEVFGAHRYQLHSKA